MCDALNSIPDTKTEYSCEGHYFPAPHRPYVQFVTPEKIAKNCSFFLLQDRKLNELTYKWRLSGRWTPLGSFVYTIEPNDSRITKVAPWRRKTVNKDIRNISAFVANLKYNIPFAPDVLFTE